MAEAVSQRFQYLLGTAVPFTMVAGVCDPFVVMVTCVPVVGAGPGAVNVWPLLSVNQLIFMFLLCCEGGRDKGPLCPRGAT